MKQWFRLVALVITIGVSGCFGQVVTASLEGTVTDPSGAGVPRANVEVQNTSTGVSIKVQTSDNGHFVAPSLQAGGPYRILVTANGFKTAERSGIPLDVNQQATVNIPLEIGSSTQTVQVTGEAPLLEASSAAIGQVIDNRSIVNLPLNQRNAYALVFLVPGSTGTVGYNYNSANISINGGRPGTTDILVDGIPSSPPAVNPIISLAVFPSVDAVEQFKVQTNGYSAEFGRSGGGIINLIYKSGTNTFHGSAFEFLRNSALDANDFFSNAHGTPLPSFKRSQFGGSLGGPVLIPKLYNGRDKTFFFVAYEGLRQGSAISKTITVPTALQRAGDFSQTRNTAGQLVQIYNPYTTVPSGSGYVRSVFQGNVIPPSLLNPVALNILKYYPLPNTPGTASGANNYFASGTTILNTNTIDTKVDENINEKNRFFVRYSHRGLNQPIPALFPAAALPAEGQVAGDSPAQISNSAAFDYTYTASPTFLMDLRYGFARNFINYTAISSGFNPTTLGFPSYIAANADHLLFPGIAATNYVTLGDANQGQERTGSFASHLWSLNNTKILSNHNIRFGAEARVILVNDAEAGASTGNFTFTQAITQGPNPNVATSTAGNSIASLLLGVGSGNMGISLKDAATKSDYFAWYGQDDWKLSRKLTLNLGLRYELDLARTERYNRMTSIDTNVISPLAAAVGIPNLRGGVQFAGANGNPRRQFPTPLKNWAPRFGLAYQLTNTTVLRGGFGLFYSPSYREAGATIGQQGYGSSTQYVGSPNGLTPSVFISNPFPDGLNPVLGSSQGLLSGIGSSFSSPIAGDNRIPYSLAWNFDIQQQLPGNFLIDAAYVGSHSIHLTECGESDCNLDQLTPQALSLGTALQTSVRNPFFGYITTGPLAAATVPRSYLAAPFPQYTALYGSYITGGFSFYNSFQLKVEKRFSRGLSLLVSFTGQKLIDNYSIISNVGNSSGIQNIYDMQGQKAVSSNDISRALVVSAVYNLPFGHGQKFGSGWNRFEDALFGGWQLNGISTNQTGFPIAVSTQNTSNAGNNVLRPNNNGQSAGIDGPIINRLSQYFNTSVFSQPAAFTFGNTGRTLPNVRAPGLHNLDFSLFKGFRIAERLRGELRGEAFNLLNQVVFGAPNSVLTSGQFGVISTQSNTPRSIQVALKLLF